MLRIGLSVVLCLLTAVLAIVTFAALWPTNLWWVRMTDFPRLQYLIALAVVVVGIALARPVASKLRIGLAVVAVAAIAFKRLEACPLLAGGAGPGPELHARKPGFRHGREREA